MAPSRILGPCHRLHRKPVCLCIVIVNHTCVGRNRHEKTANALTNFLTDELVKYWTVSSNTPRYIEDWYHHTVRLKGGIVQLFDSKYWKRITIKQVPRIILIYLIFSWIVQVVIKFILRLYEKKNQLESYGRIQNHMKNLILKSPVFKQVPTKLLTTALTNVSLNQSCARVKTCKYFFFQSRVESGKGKNVGPRQSSPVQAQEKKAKNTRIDVFEELMI